MYYCTLPSTSALDGVGCNTTPRLLYLLEDPVPTEQEAGSAPGPVWMGTENLVPTGIRSADSPARSESLYRLSYPGHKIFVKLWLNYGNNMVKLKFNYYKIVVKLSKIVVKLWLNFDKIKFTFMVELR